MTKVITFGVPLGNGARISQFSYGEFQIQVRGSGAESTDGARELAEELAGYLGVESPAAADEGCQAAEVARVAALIVLHGYALGARYSAGAYTPAVPSPFAFAVLNQAAAPVMLAHDAFEVARWLVGLEAGTVAEMGLERPIEMPTDADLAAAELADRVPMMMWQAHPAVPERRLRAPEDKGYDKRCAHCREAAPHTNREHFAAMVRG